MKCRLIIVTVHPSDRCCQKRHQGSPPHTTLDHLQINIRRLIVRHFWDGRHDQQHTERYGDEEHDDMLRTVLEHLVFLLLFPVLSLLRLWGGLVPRTFAPLALGSSDIIFISVDWWLMSQREERSYTKCVRIWQFGICFLGSTDCLTGLSWTWDQLPSLWYMQHCSEWTVRFYMLQRKTRSAPVEAVQWSCLMYIHRTSKDKTHTLWWEPKKQEVGQSVYDCNCRNTRTVHHTR